MLDRIALALLIIGGLNWGSIGIFRDARDTFFDEPTHSAT